MFRISCFAIMFLVVNFFIGVFATQGDIEGAYKALTSPAEWVKGRIVPDMISNAPTELATVHYQRTKLQEGQKLSPDQTVLRPTVAWHADPNYYYTLIMVGPSLRITNRNFQHWLTVNIPGADVAQGETLSQYIMPIAIPGGGVQRYALLVYRQPSKTQFHELGLPGLTTINLAMFSLTHFVEKYGLGEPVAGNFFSTQFPLPELPVVNQLLGTLSNA